MEAVFQLLIGIFTAVLIVTIAYKVLGAVQLNRCHEKWQNSAVQLANALADAARSSGATNFIQISGKCGRASYVEYSLVEHSGRNSRDICNRVCHKPVNTCYVIRYTAIATIKGRPTELDQGFYCADISPYTYYQMQNSTDESCAVGGTSGGSSVTYTNVTGDLVASNGKITVKYPVVNAFVRSTGYGDEKKVYVCAQGVE